MDEIKSKLKNWESTFHLQYNRKPSKVDIRQFAPPDILTAYKHYAEKMKLKSSIDHPTPPAPPTKKTLQESNSNNASSFNDLWDTPVQLKSPPIRSTRPQKPKPATFNENLLEKMKLMRSSLKRTQETAMRENSPEPEEPTKASVNPVARKQQPFAIMRRQSYLKSNICKLSSMEEEIFETARSLPPVVVSQTNENKASPVTTLPVPANPISPPTPHETTCVERSAIKEPPAKRMKAVLDPTAGVPSPCDVVPTTTATTSKASVTMSLGGGDSHSSLRIPAAASKAVPLAGNYVKINLRRKCFSKKGSAKQKFLRKKVLQGKWRRKMQSTSQESACFACGQTGHWASKCPSKWAKKGEKSAGKPPAADPAAEEEAAGVVCESDFRCLQQPSACSQPMHDLDPTATAASSLQPISMPSEALQQHLSTLGHKQFRPNQEAVIQRILLGKSTLAVMPTGAGKSLCYQLAAMLFHQQQGRTALIISPLISLMLDQTQRLPPNVSGVCLNSTLSRDQRDKILSEAKHDAKYDFIMISPEALVDYHFLTPERLPPISFVCIDEAHCLADWSHHFRPAYLRVCAHLRRKFDVHCFLGLSATCTAPTLSRIAGHLGIDVATDQEGCIAAQALPDNIHLSVSRDVNRDEALLHLLMTPPFCECASIIIYCSSRDQTVKVASLLRTALKEVPEVKVGRRKLSWKAIEAYHAGMTNSERARAQNRFMQNRTRVLVATSAFGMGVNKTHLPAVIHYGRPKSFENYVQEVGRSGRDGEPAWCHTLLPAMQSAGYYNAVGCLQEEVSDIQRHIYANYVDFVSLKRLIKKLFGNFQCGCSTDACVGHLRYLPIQATVEELDFREETLMTLLCYLELEESCALRILSSQYSKALINCYAGPKQLAEISRKNEVIAAALGEFQKTNQIPATDFCSMRSLQVNILELSSQFGWDPWLIRRGLSDLEWTTSANAAPRKSGVQVNFQEWALCVSVKGQLTDADLDRLLNYLLNRVKNLEIDGLKNMERLTDLLCANAAQTVTDMNFTAEEYLQESSKLREDINTYFSQPTGEWNDAALSEPPRSVDPPPDVEATARNVIRQFIMTYDAEFQLQARSIACVLHGIATPCYPMHVWSKSKRFWRCMLRVSWPKLFTWCNEELLQFRR